MVYYMNEFERKLCSDMKEGKLKVVQVFEG